MIGKVIDICNGGTIVTVYVQSQGRIYTVVFDHRCFWDFAENTVGSPTALLGRKVEVEGQLDEQIVNLVS